MPVTGRFLPGGQAITVTVNGGTCAVVNIPDDACAASLVVQLIQGQTRGPLSALVEYSD